MAQEKIPETCPGTESQAAGTADGCAGCPNQNACKTAPKGPDPDLQIIKEKFQSTIKSKILVLSGKGGVGKSTFTANLANALASDESKQIGLLDIDLCGPSIPRMMGLVGEQIHNSAAGWSPVYSSDNLAVMSIGFLLQNHDDAVIWRGPKKNGLIKQFLKDVDWATPEQPLDYLLVDTPPGTSDEHISLVQYLKNTGIDGAVLITTPQYLSIQDVIKEINFCKKVGIHVIGVVENMSGFICPNTKCSKESLIFPPSTTCNVQQMAKDMDVNYLGSIPLDTRIAKSCDLGESFLDLYPDSIASKAYIKIIDGIKSNLSSRG